MWKKKFAVQKTVILYCDNQCIELYRIIDINIVGEENFYFNQVESNPTNMSIFCMNILNWITGIADFSIFCRLPSTINIRLMMDRMLMVGININDKHRNQQYSIDKHQNQWYFINIHLDQWDSVDKYQINGILLIYIWINGILLIKWNQWDFIDIHLNQWNYVDIHPNQSHSIDKHSNQWYSIDKHQNQWHSN